MNIIYIVFIQYSFRKIEKKELWGPDCDLKPLTVLKEYKES